MTNKNYRILVVDDEQDLCEILKFNLETEGYEVETTGSSEEALTLNLPSFDLLLLDVMMGEMSGFALARRLKADDATKGIPIIFLTARDTENDTVTGFNLGADDYISKPFSIREVMVRVRAVLRRGASESEKNVVCGPLVMNEARFSAKVDGKDVKLGVIEFRMLLVLASNPGRVYSRVQLLERVWDDAAGFDERTVDVHVLRLRKQLAGTSAANIVQTVRGIGYRAADPSSAG